MSTYSKKLNTGRRDFLCRMSILGGAVLTTFVIPLSLFAVTPAVRDWRAADPGPYTPIDEALGNYPAYSATIGYGHTGFDDSVSAADFDSQFGY